MKTKNILLTAFLAYFATTTNAQCPDLFFKSTDIEYTEKFEHWMLVYIDTNSKMQNELVAITITSTKMPESEAERAYHPIIITTDNSVAHAKKEIQSYRKTGNCLLTRDGTNIFIVKTNGNGEPLGSTKLLTITWIAATKKWHFDAEEYRSDRELHRGDKLFTIRK